MKTAMPAFDPGGAIASPCPACGGEAFTPVETITVDRLAEVFTTYRVSQRFDARCGRAVRDLVHEQSAQTATAITRAIGASVIRFDRCSRCELEVSTPRRCWPEGSYPEDENYPVRWEFGRFLDDLGPRPVRVLELGSGQGQFLALARERGHQGIGLDFSPGAVDVACGRGLEVLCGGFDRLREHLGRHPDRTFDAVAIFHVIEHLPDPGEVFDRLADFVRPGTQMAVSCPGPRRFTKLIDVQQVGACDFWDYPPHHVLRWTLPALTTFLTGRGWDVAAALEEPLARRGAAAQIGVTRALWGGRMHRRWRTRLGIVAARARLAVTRRVGLSLYVRATYRGR